VLIAGTITTAMAAIFLIAPSSPIAAPAQDGFDCSKTSEQGRCIARVAAPSTDGSGGHLGGGSDAPVFNGCRNSTTGESVPCTKGGRTWSGSHNCYTTGLTNQRIGFLHKVSGTTPADGTYYACADTGQIIFFPTGTTPTPPDPADLAQQVIASFTFSPIQIGLVPRPPNRGLVGIPVWMWVAEPSSTTWGPLKDGLSALGVAVKVTGEVEKVVWNMGDGRSLTCQQGTPYERTANPNAASPNCGHRYDRKGEYSVTATSHWAFNWTSNTAASGTETVQLQSTETVRIGELQVVN
jgi:hypothetical protein